MRLCCNNNEWLILFELISANPPGTRRLHEFNTDLDNIPENTSESRVKGKSTKYLDAEISSTWPRDMGV